MMIDNHESKTEIGKAARQGVTDDLSRPASQIATELAATWRSYLPDHAMGLLRTRGTVGNLPLTEKVAAVVLFADVAGFTTMAESLAGSGSYGTERLTSVINQWFAVTAEAIVTAGGSVVDFAGDALVGMFRYTPETASVVARRAMRCAEIIREATASVSPVPTPDGQRPLAIRIGLASGPLLVMILGDFATRLQHLVAGPALDSAVAALHRAERDEIAVDPHLLDIAGPAIAVPAAPVVPVAPIAELEELLAPFLHSAIRTRLRSGRHELINEHRKVTTAFVRLPDLSADDPDTVQTLQRYLGTGVAIIERYGGHLRHLMTDDKGTVMVAVFGTPVSHENDEERALRCCIELLALPGGPYRGGITTGRVYCGEVGSDLRREYAVVGDAVNLAARLMQAAPAGHLLIDQATHDRVRDIILHPRPAAVAAKGKADPVPVWIVRETQEAGPPSIRPSTTHGPLVGRASELGLLDRFSRQVSAGVGQLIWLHGEAGIGKTRLADEMLCITRSLGFTEYTGGCRSHGMSTSYLIWRSIFRKLLEIDPDLPVPTQQEALTERISRYDGSGLRAPLLAAVINLPMADNELTAQLEPSGREELLRSTLLAALRDRTVAGPLILLLEDCHWIDPASLALLEHLVQQIADLPVLVVATSRESMPEKLTGPAHVADLRLAQMIREDAEQLATLRLRERHGEEIAIAPEVLRQISEQANGNAFYVEELVSYLHGRGIDPGDPRALVGVPVPDNLQRLVMARIDQLSDDEKATIKVASVIGRRFQPPWIASVYPAAGTAPQVAGHLGRLHALDLTPRIVPGAQAEYQFKHPVTQEAAYQSITYDTRASLHERVGLFIEETYADRLAQYVDVLAHHYARTERTDKQRDWFRAAGDRAKEMFANETATYYYGLLLPLLAEAERAELHVEIGSVHQHTGQWAEAEDHYLQAMRLARTTGRRDVLASAQRQLGDLLMYTRSDDEPVTWLQRALAEFERLDDGAGQCRTLDRLTFALYRQGAYSEALEMAGRHLELATRLGDLTAISAALEHTGLVYVNTGRPEAAFHHLRRSLSTAEEAGDRQRMLNAACNLGFAAQRGTDHVQAIDSYMHALQVARDIGAGQTANIIVGNIGEIYRDEGMFEQARICAMRSLRVAVELRDWMIVTDQVANLGVVAAAEGDDEAAQPLLERAIEMARHLSLPYFLCVSLHRLAKLHLAAGRAESAERLNSEALRIAKDHDERDTRVSAYIFSIHLRVRAARLQPLTATEVLRRAIDESSEPHEVAALLDAVWQLDPRDEDARTTAADIYRTLYKRAPSIEYRRAYQRLTNDVLPPGPPLPELPDWIAAEDGADLDDLLERIDRSAREPRAV
ncbi:tetratricopeptide repeat protein [Actinoplanes regularis]|uniref:Adenylate and Guanylate cyclase catalytic domain-containing protein n=1 Tax=Actinoplanes regularis TaxID=52697 RepID=A0A239D1Z0_9ACTN|nr:tetratricopeptide repeat protein [Actinoplanes regularis]SNS26360.1 Adenylate and Guanylate cyclase catalytic domain-containing protein [Actinoplanes regularis]